MIDFDDRTIQTRMRSFVEYIGRSRPHFDFIREGDDCSVRERTVILYRINKLGIRDVRIQCKGTRDLGRTLLNTA